MSPTDPTIESRPVTPPPPGGPAPAAPPPSPPRRSLAAVTVGLVLVTVGVLALLATLGVDIPLVVVGPVLLVLLGAGVVISALRGEPSGGVLAVAVVLGVLLAIASLVGSVLDVPLRGGIGERQHRPTTAAELEDDYRLLIGSLQLDLSDVVLEPGTTEVEVSTMIGEVEVQVPDDVAVLVESQVGGGAARVLGTTEEGVSVDNDQQTEGYANADQRLHLRVAVGLGEVRVN